MSQFKNLLLCTLLLSQFLYAKGEKMVYETTNLTLDSANKLIDIAKNIATEKNLKLSIAILDSNANLIAFSRMDEAALVTIDVAIGKAKTAALIKAPSKLFEDKINSGETSMLAVPNLTSLQGGIPVIYNGKVCGAIGVSGASGDTDNEVATFTVKKFMNNKD